MTAAAATDREALDALDLPAYLDRIGVSRADSRAPTLDTLRALHLGHSTTIPFENLDVLLGRPIRLDLASLQAKLVEARRGGYCFEHNVLFAAVLEALGFPVTRLAARVYMGPPSPARPRTHMLLRVEVGAEPWLADVGFGRDGLLEPVPFDPGPAVSQVGRDPHSGLGRRSSAGPAGRALRPQVPLRHPLPDGRRAPLRTRSRHGPRVLT
jgi:N-hydroxyarylamine O-acetyltransferase